MKLLASSKSLEGIISCISRYWYANNGEITLHPFDGGWHVENNGKHAVSYYVIKKGKRYRFERID